MDLGSAELVQNTEALLNILQSGVIQILFCNEKEAEAVAKVVFQTAEPFKFCLDQLSERRFLLKVTSHPL